MAGEAPALYRRALLSTELIRPRAETAGNSRTQCASVIASTRVLPHAGSYGANRHRILCQNCVTSPLETLVKSVSYGDVPKQIVVSEVVDRKVCWKDLVCVSTRGRSQSKRA